MMNSLEANTTYHVRAYAINEAGTAYGLDKEFTTNRTEGALSGDFSVSETEKVRFSKGNLQYRASTNTWRFAENQWDYVGEGNTNASAFYDGWIDLFGWGTSGYNHGAGAYQPWSTSRYLDAYYAYGDKLYNLYDQTGQADWGYNAISNGGNTENSGWRTLTQSEWDYVFNERATLSGVRYVGANVNGLYFVVFRNVYYYLQIMLHYYLFYYLNILPYVILLYHQSIPLSSFCLYQILYMIYFQN